MRNNKKKHRILIGAVALIAVVTVGIVRNHFTTDAAFNRDTAVHIKADEIEDSTLIIGTHLIHISAMTEELYNIAQDSAADSGQYNRYYKSELAGGAWYDITEASTLSEITTEGKPVPNSEIEELYMTHHTKSDKITYDLQTGEAVSLFDIDDPYDLSSMEELKPLKDQYDLIDASRNSRDGATLSESDSFCLNIAWYILAYNSPKNKMTAECDKQLTALQGYYDELASEDGFADELGMVTEVMDSIDATRRAEVFYQLLNGSRNELTYKMKNSASLWGDTENRNNWILEDEEDTSSSRYSWMWWLNQNQTQTRTFTFPSLETYLNRMYGTESAGQPTEGYTPNTNLINGLTESITNVQDSYLEYSGKSLSAGSTILSMERYAAQTSLISNAANGTYSACDQNVDELINLDNIGNNVIKDQAAELSLLESELYPKSRTAYLASVWGGAGDEYQAVSSNQNKSKATLAKVLRQQMNDADTQRQEMQFFIQAKVDRISSEDAKAWVEELLDETKTLSASVKEDDYAPYAKQSLDAYRTWLEQLLKDIVAELGGSSTDKLLEQKDAYEKAKLACLDDNDLAGAAKYDALLSAINDKIEQESTLNGSSAEYVIEDIVNQIISEAKDGDTDSAERSLDALSTLGQQNPYAVSNALDGLTDSLKNIADSDADNKALGRLLDSARNMRDNLELPDAEDKDSLADIKALKEQVLDAAGRGDIDGANDALASLYGYSADSPHSVSQALASIADNISDELAKRGVTTGTGNAAGGSSNETENGNGNGNSAGSGEGTGVEGSSESGTGSESGAGSESETGSENGTGSESGTGEGSSSETGSSTTTDSVTDELAGLLDNVDKLRDDIDIDSGVLSQTDLKDILAELMGENLGKLSKKDQATALLALQLYADYTKADSVARLVGQLAEQFYQNGNGYIYLQYKDPTTEFVSTKAISTCLGYRYVFNNSEMLVVLSKKGVYYTYHAYDKIARKEEDNETEMTLPAGFQSTIYLEEGYTKVTFDCEGVYLSNSDLALLVTEQIRSEAQKIFEELMERGGV